MRLLIILMGFIFFIPHMKAQMNIEGSTLYGNEWIDYSQDHYKFHLTEDGVYRIPRAALSDAGIPVDNIDADNFQLYAFGEQVPVYISTTGTLGANDYIEFYGKKNRGEMDVHLYSSPEDQFNPLHSLYSDSLAYFLTWDNAGGSNSRLVDTPNDLTNPPVAETHFTHESYQVFNNKFNPGKFYGGLLESTFSPGEGYGGSFMPSGAAYEVATNHAYSAGDDAQLTIKFASRRSDVTDWNFANAGENVAEVELSVVNGANEELGVGGVPVAINLGDPDPDANIVSITYCFSDISQPLTGPLSDITEVKLTGIGPDGSEANHAVSYIKIEYPRIFNFDNNDEFKFNLSGEANTPKYLEITNFAHGGTAPVLYDLTNGLRLTTELNGSTIRVVLPPSEQDRELVLFNPSTASDDLDGLIETNFTDFTIVEGDYLILSHSKFINDASGIVQNYSDYRASTGFTPIIINLEEVYDQFAYGISRHSQSIRNFTGYTLDNWLTTPKYMFMIGKARPFKGARFMPETQPSYTPTFGHPHSDMLLTATTMSNTPRIPFGRIPVVTVDDIATYLDKVMAHENTQLNPLTHEDRLRSKRVIQLGGGDANILTTIRNSLNENKNIIEGTQVGAEVISFLVDDLEPWQADVSRAELLRSLINDDGVNLITFLGHGLPQSIDYNIDNPDDFTNQGKYFTFFATGCDSGLFFTKARNISERFVFANDRAAVAFIGNSIEVSLGSADALIEYFYDKMSNEKYGEGLGDIMQATISDIENADENVYRRMVIQHVTLNGDPALKLNYGTESNESTPDYIIDEETISFGPEVPTNREVNLTFTVKNTGQAIDGQFTISIDRILPGNTTVNAATVMVDAPFSEKEYTIMLDNIENGGGQTHQYRITIDANNDIAELFSGAESNNTALAEVFLLNNVVEVLQPREFGIEGDASNITLKAAIAPAFFNTAQDYYIEIDITESFDNPLETATITSAVGDEIIEWTPTINYTDGTVYYWRVREDANLGLGTPGWVTSSFIYLNGESPGWNQSDFYQFDKDELVNLDYTMNNGFEFVGMTTNEVVVNNGYCLLGEGAAQVGVLPNYEIDYSVNGGRIYDVEGCEKSINGLYVVLFDEDMKPFQNTSQGLYGSYVCGGGKAAFLFPTSDATGQQNLTNFFQTQLSGIADVSYVLVYSLNDYMPETWSASLSSTLINKGFPDLGNSTNGFPYAGMIDLTSGTAEPVLEVMGESEDDIIEAIFTYDVAYPSGRLRSVPIELGNSPAWGSLHWEVNNLEAGDDAYINVYGLTEANEEVLLVEKINQLSYHFNPTVFDPALYPRIRLEYVVSDETNHTAPQLEYWRVHDIEDSDGDLVSDYFDDCPNEPGLINADGCPDIRVSVRVFLEGAYNPGTNSMNMGLRDRGMLPGQTPASPLATPTPAGQPYNVAPWNYNGTESSNYYDIVDWVLVSLRTGTDKASEVGRIAVRLAPTGYLLINEIETTTPGPYYIVIEHRNHMGVMSPNPVELINGVVSYDFTISDSYKNITSFGQKQLDTGEWVMYGGDGNQVIDQVSYDINGSDKGIWGDDNGKFNIYKAADYNMDGEVNGADKGIWFDNAGVSSRVPK